MNTDYKIFNRIPEGWFRLASSRQVKPLKFLPVEAFGEQFYLYRDKQNQVHAYKPYCPHMGMSVKTFERDGDQLKCPFHAFKYSTEGHCVEAYGHRSDKLKLDLGYPLVEKNSQLFIYYTHDKAQPTWEIPDLEPGWTPYLYESSVFDSSPQEISENLVDYGHFEATHGFRVISEPDMKVEGPIMKVNFDTLMPDKYLFHLNKAPLVNRLEGYLYGLGYTIVDSHLYMDDKLLLTSRTINFKTPISGRRIHFTKGYSARRCDPSVGPAVVRGLRDYTYLMISAIGGYFAYREDMAIWKNKLYLDNPKIVRGDGPVAQFRKWAGQFYEQDNVLASDRPERCAANG